MKTRLDSFLQVLLVVVILVVTVVRCQTTFEWNPRDNHKPHFRDCKDYKPSLKEEQQKNSFVIQVKAYDPDEGDTITYKILHFAQERPKFQIDPKSGVITTGHAFDRDEPIHEKEVYITVQATDDGRPRLDDVCTFKLTIEDINDNPPVFNKGRYDESMSEDTQVNSTVMRISATDLDDGDNSIVRYRIVPDRDYEYFRIDEQHGLIYLNRTIDRQPGRQYVINVHAFNIIQDYPQDAQTEVRIRIVESNKKPPEFTNIHPPNDVISMPEDYRDFSTPIVKMEARSNVPDKPEVIFELVTGRTEQTNNKKTFVFNQIGNTAVITLGQALDYEAITEYTLTMSVRNTYDLVAEHIIKIKVEDVNDNIPYFTEWKSGVISENEPIGTPVMQVRAFDMDGTEANNIIHFELADNTEYFAIDPQTGNITALKEFDREERDFYNVKVIASDNSPSSLYNTGEPNRGNQVFRIQIADKNDHKPHFRQDEYIADKLPENANINSVVIEVNAIDEDNEAQIAYTIEEGNVGEAFKIEPLTGKITVNKPLDYETITEYTLKIKANDGMYEDHATVTIRIEDVNDNPPVFKSNYSTTIEEEKIYDDCILIIEAYDPDIKDRTADQKLNYSVVKTEMQSYLDIDKGGCLRLKKPLDRDEPFGHKNWQILIAANDENGNGLKSVTDVTISLSDINDNAPFLTTSMPVIWSENRDPGEIIKLQAHDYDESQNGPPFTYSISENAPRDIKAKFVLDSTGRLNAIVTFDREEQKEYFIPINITDSGFPEMSNVSWLHLIIGDVNDNPMKDGSSKIFVYNYKGEAPDTEIGRVYVDDKDDWDWGDKDFVWNSETYSEHFSLNSSTGYITMLQGTPPGEYILNFIVTEQSNLIPKHSVSADVTVTVKEIPEEAVDKSGSIRFINVTGEDFIKLPRDADPGMLNMKDRLQRILARLFNTSVENVDVFTVFNYNASILDVRFSAHGSPYYEAEKLNGLVAQNQNELERQLGVQILMVNIDECLIEKYKCESSCTNILHKSNVPLLVYTNTTSFVGVNAFTQAECVCLPRRRNVCLNGGTANDDETCECIDGFTGPNCELVAIGFYGHGYAMYPPVSACDNTKIAMELSPNMENGLVMYIGPMNYNEHLPLSDFLSLELVEGFPVLTVDYGTGAVRIEHKYIKLSTGKTYAIDILLQRSTIEMTVDNCKLSTCMSLGAPQGPNEFLNVNSPLQLGGTPVNLEMLGLQLNWTHIPQSTGYSGCVRNLTIDGFTYNLGRPALSKYADPGCQNAVAVAVSFNIGKNFLIPILICIICLIILILAFVVHKRQQSGWLEKDTDDIRENIINYEDEGGGERDTDYDLNVLRAPPLYEDKPYKTNLLMKEPNDVPDIGGFLGDKKDSCDKDQGAYPVDDVRHYAYEGDGNSTGSLSSLASCTDDGDLDFDYLSNFGPRFRKLADMYGEEPSDTDSNVDDDQGWRI